MASMRSAALVCVAVALIADNVSAAVISKGDLLFLDGNTLLVSSKDLKHLIRRAMCSCTHPSGLYS